MKTHHDLLAWQKSISFVTKLYKLIATFPENEKYGISTQLRRASVSIPSNIAEGASRETTKDFKRFLYISLSSSVEIETQLIICKNLNLLSVKQYEDIHRELVFISKLIQGLIKSITNKI